MLDAESSALFQRLPILPLRVRISSSQTKTSLISVELIYAGEFCTLYFAYLWHSGRIVLYILFLRTFLSDLSIFKKM